METKDSTHEVEQEIVNPQDSATANDADLISEEQTAENAENTMSQEPEAETVTEVSAHEVTEPEVEAIDIEDAIEPEAEIIISETIEESELVTEAEEVKLETETEASAPETEEVSETIAEATVEVTEVVNDTEIEEAVITDQTLKNSETHEVIELDKEVDYSELPLEQLVEQLTLLVAYDDIAAVKVRVGQIKAQYIKKIKQIKQDHFDTFISEGGTEETYETIKYDFESNYQAAFAIYKEKRTKYIQELELLKEANLKKKEELLEALRNMINSDENLNKIYKEFSELQTQWREIGLVPQTQVNNLWENYHFLVEKFFDKVKINKELMMMGLNKNLEEKILICEKAEELLLEKSINKSFKLLQEYHDKWKEIGPVPQEKNDEIWDRFRNASDKVNVRRHEYYEKLHEEQNSNLLLKTALCEKVEAILEEKPETNQDWNAKTDEVNLIFAEWKTLGPAPKKINDIIWQRFRLATNSFFDARKEFTSIIKDEQMNNYHLKLDLIARAEAVMDSTDWKATTLELVKLQRKWKEIGQVPRKYSDKIWKKFRGSCDKFFKAKEEFFKNIGQVEIDNMQAKLNLIETISAHVFGENQEENLKVIKGFQRQWIEIGRVPIKDKAKLQSDYSKAIDKHLSALNINSFEFENAGFKNKVEQMQNKDDAGRLILKEISYLRGKIDTLQKDVTLWDTNISFFANSKNADLLKADFEKKIEKGKKEIEVYKAKIRQFDKMMRGIKEDK